MVSTYTAAEPVLTATTGSFEDFFRETYPHLAKAALLLTGNEAEAEDLAQEALARAFERWARVRVMASPDGYVYRTALNLHRKAIRRARGRPVDPAPQSSVDPSVGLADRDLILRALQQLPIGLRVALVLVDWAGMPTNEAASVLRLNPASVRVRLHRGRKALRTLMGGRDG